MCYVTPLCNVLSGQSVTFAGMGNARSVLEYVMGLEREWVSHADPLLGHYVFLQGIDEAWLRRLSDAEVEFGFLRSVMGASGGFPVMLGLREYDIVGTQEALWGVEREVKRGMATRLWVGEVDGEMLADEGRFGGDAKGVMYLVPRGCMKLVLPHGCSEPFSLTPDGALVRFGFRVEGRSVIRFSCA